MECVGRFKSISKDWISGKWLITFEADENITGYIDKIKDKLLRITCKTYREKRSLDANAYAWVLMQKIAEATHTDKWTIYLRCLERYSRVFTHILVLPAAVEMAKAEWRATLELGEVVLRNEETGDEVTFVQLQCYAGSSSFDTKEMSVFLSGIVDECKGLGIETLSPAKIDEMNQRWGVSL